MLAFEAVLLYDLIPVLTMVSFYSIIARRFAKGADAKIRIDSWIFGPKPGDFYFGQTAC
jgi:hypothetical protein